MPVFFLRAGAGSFYPKVPVEFAGVILECIYAFNGRKRRVKQRFEDLS